MYADWVSRVLSASLLFVLFGWMTPTELFLMWQACTAVSVDTPRQQHLACVSVHL